MHGYIYIYMFKYDTNVYYLYNIHCIGMCALYLYILHILSMCWRVIYARFVSDPDKTIWAFASFGSYCV